MNVAALGRVAAIRRVGGAAPRRGLGAAIVATVAFLALVLLVQRLDAPLALAIAALMVAGVAMLVRPELATLLMVFLLYINFPAILTKQHGVPHLVAGTFIVLLGFPLLESLIHRRESLRVDLTFHLMLLLLGVYLVASFFARDVGVALGTIQEYVLEGLLLYWLIFNVIRSARTLRRVIWTVLLAGGLLSGLSLYQTVTGSYDQEFGGLAYRNYEEVQDVPGHGEVRRRTWDRAQGPLNEPNRFAQILIVLLPLSAAALRNARSGSARVVAAACGVLIAGGVVATLSRGAFVTLLVLAALMVALRWVRPSRAILFAVALALAAPSVPFFETRMMATVRALGLVPGDAPALTHTLDGAARTRMTVMLAAVRVFRDHPVLGVGPGQFAPFYSQEYGRNPDIKFRDLPPGAWRAHSLYLEIAAETGLLGLSVFVGIVILLLHRLWAMRRRWLGRDQELADLATAFGLSLIAYQLTGVFLHLSYQPYYWFLLALTGAALHILSRPAAGDAPPAARGGEGIWRP